MARLYFTRLTWLAFLTVSAVLAGCGRGDQPAVAAGTAPQECRSREGGSRWASSGGGYAEAGVHGHGPEWLAEVAGVAELGGLTYVYDAGRARVVVLDEAFRPVRTIGREGKGPGELEPDRDMGRRGAAWAWMETADSSLIVFDGFRLQTFNLDGSLARGRLERPVRRGVVNYEADRLRIRNGAIVSASGGYKSGRKGQAPNEWSLLRSTEMRTTPILSLQLAAPPRSRGVPFIGPQQARPVWDALNGCVIASDGTGRWLVRSDENGRSIDTLALELPDLERPKLDVAVYERLLGAGGGGGYVGPTAVRDIDAIVIDPDGYAWILPVQDSAVAGEGVEVVRLALQTGETVRDTVPAFPTAFGQPGVFYARTGGMEEPALVRYRLSATKAVR